MIYRTKLLKKIKRRWILAILACTALAILCRVTVLQSYLLPDMESIYWTWDVLEEMEDTSCHYIDTEDTLPRADSESFLPPSRSIFFHETSCKGDLNSRQSCAIESAARAHPEWQINVLFTAPVPRYKLKTGSLAVLRNITNVKLARVHVSKYAKGTPLESMVSGGALNRTRWRITHTSDVLRFLSLYKFGGVYLDLDVVVAKALDPLGRNWAARETDSFMGSAALSFSRDEIGRNIAEAAIRDIKNKFRGDMWSHNSNGVITRILQHQCSTTNVTQMSAATCNGFEVYGPQFFRCHPVEAVGYYKAYFVPGEIQDDIAYVFHVFNKRTSKFTVHKDSPYVKLAKKYCPDIYKLYDIEFGL